MPDAVEPAIEGALLARLSSFAATQSPALVVSYPNVGMTPPEHSQNAKWLRARFLPADTAPLGVGFESTNQHFGLFQIDVMHGQGSGEIQPARIGSQIIAYFKRGTVLTKDGFSVRIERPPFRGQMFREDPWVVVPVRVPYFCYAANPA